MLTTEMSESIRYRIEIENFEPEIVDVMLSFLYTGQLRRPSGSSQLMDLLQIGHKYELGSLMEDVHSCSKCHFFGLVAASWHFVALW